MGSIVKIKKGLLLFLLMMLAISCSRNQRQKSSLFGSRIPGSSSASDGRGEWIVRVKLYSGEALTVTAENYTFHTGRSTRRGHGSFTFTEEGMLVPQGNFVLRGRRYSGTLEARRRGGEWLYINHVPIDDYLTSVVSHEMSPSWHREALKAQAVVARTYLLVKMKERAKEPYDVDSSTNFQVYGGLKKEERNARAAVNETHNEVLLYDGKLAETYFHSSCGGVLASSEEVWGRMLPYLSVQSSPYCATAPVYKWQVTIPLSEISKRLALRGVKNITVLERPPSKRVKPLRVSTATGDKPIRAEKFRALLGTLKIKSTFFGVAKKGNAVVLTGRGFGHGVGLCQWGAKNQAEERGMDYRRILEHYFPRTVLRSVNSQQV
ncbi:MAG: SpoIID/LytB domain-containing protein [Turneriella sp.]|nr:SpoIID/LytB domain-containing protein [Turneriella sp.]